MAFFFGSYSLPHDEISPIRSLLRCPVLFGRLAQWLLQLSEFEIIPIAPIAGKGQAIADLLAWFTTLMDKIIKRQ